MRDTTAQTRFESVSKQFNDSLLTRGNKLQSDEDRIELKEFMALYTNLLTRVLELKKTKTTQSNEIASLKRKVKKLEKKNRSRTHKLKRLYKGEDEAIDQDEDITLVNDQDDAKMFDVNDLGGEEVFVAEQEVELGDILVRVATTASSLEVDQDSGGGPRCQETMGDTTSQTRFESVSKQFNDSLLTRGNTLQSDEDRIELNELMALYTNLLTRVLELKKTKTTQSNEIASLKRKVKKLEKKNRSRTHKLKRLYKVGLKARVESSNDECLGEDASKQGRMKL
nr:hypothetical protein [Tanacetum cinerariifolium]